MEAEEKEDAFKFSDLKKFSKLYWLNNFSGILQLCVIVGYQQFAQQMLVTRWGYSNKEAGAYIPIPTAMYALLGPFLGYVLDRCGHRMDITNFACVLLVCTQIFDMLAPDCDDQCSYPIIILVSQGVCMSLAFALNYGSIVAFVTDPTMYGRGFGVIAASNNMLLAAEPMFLGWVHDASIKVDHGFFWLSFTFLVIALIALGFNLALWWEDR